MAACGIYERETFIASYFPEGAGALIKIIEICAATQCHVLAVVDLVTVRKAIRGSAATQKRALFEQCNAKSSLS
jgi:hypothetical protein